MRCLYIKLYALTFQRTDFNGFSVDGTLDFPDIGSGNLNKYADIFLCCCLRYAVSTVYININSFSDVINFDFEITLERGKSIRCQTDTDFLAL